MGPESFLGDLMESLPGFSEAHRPGTPLHGFLSRCARREIERLFLDADSEPTDFGAFGRIVFPYVRMGAVDSTNCFDFNELILFAFYRANRGRYRRVADIGANLGLHAVLLDRCGFEVRAYEPDPLHFEILEKNLKANESCGVQAFNAAISSRPGPREFVRVLGNTTSSHIRGSKLNPYGELEILTVDAESVEPLMAWADFLKIDAEGHEREILLATRREHWERVDAMVEVSSPDHAEAVHGFFSDLGVDLYSQKTGWKKVRGIGDMPVSYRDGNLFISVRGEPF